MPSSLRDHDRHSLEVRKRPRISCSTERPAKSESVAKRGQWWLAQQYIRRWCRRACSSSESTLTPVKERRIAACGRRIARQQDGEGLLAELGVKPVNELLLVRQAELLHRRPDSVAHKRHLEV